MGEEKEAEGEIREAEQVLLQKQDVCGIDNLTHPSASWRVLPEHQQPL